MIEEEQKLRQDLDNSSKERMKELEKLVKKRIAAEDEQDGLSDKVLKELANNHKGPAPEPKVTTGDSESSSDDIED